MEGQAMGFGMIWLKKQERLEQETNELQTMGESHGYYGQREGEGEGYFLQGFEVFKIEN